MKIHSEFKTIVLGLIAFLFLGTLTNSLHSASAQVDPDPSDFNTRELFRVPKQLDRSDLELGHDTSNIPDTIAPLPPVQLPFIGPPPPWPTTRHSTVFHPSLRQNLDELYGEDPGVKTERKLLERYKKRLNRRFSQDLRFIGLDAYDVSTYESVKEEDRKDFEKRLFVELGKTSEGWIANQISPGTDRLWDIYGEDIDRWKDRLSFFKIEFHKRRNPSQSGNSDSHPANNNEKGTDARLLGFLQVPFDPTNPSPSIDDDGFWDFIGRIFKGDVDVNASITSRRTKARFRWTPLPDSFPIHFDIERDQKHFGSGDSIIRASIGYIDIERAIYGNHFQTKHGFDALIYVEHSLDSGTDWAGILVGWEW